MSKQQLLKTLLVSAALSSAFIVGFGYSARGEVLGQQPPRSSDSPRSVPHGHRSPHDANGNRLGRFICGATQARYFGLRDRRLNRALAWAELLPHVSPQPGAVVVQRRKGHALGGGPGGHVSRIVSLINSCRAIVTDEKGTYERNICANLVAYVRPE